MKKIFVLFCLLGLLSTEVSAACDIEDKEEIQVGGHDGVAGKCSNNGLAIECVSEGEGTDRFSCTGPEGKFDGPNLQALISTACGCGANSEEGATDQLHKELGE